MRFLLGIAALLLAFGLAWWVRERRASEIEAAPRQQRELLGLEPAATAKDSAAPRWSAVLIGRPSGAEALARPAPSAPLALPQEPQSHATQPGSREAARVPQAPAAAPAQPQSAARPASSAPAGGGEATWTVAAGNTLTSIVRAHYGSSSAALVRSVARYNGLGDGARLDIGQRLRLPPLERLRPAGG